MTQLSESMANGVVFLEAVSGGTVRLINGKNNGSVFAVKGFRARRSGESEKEYQKKVAAEFGGLAAGEAGVESGASGQTGVCVVE
jgi:hypothetical protein